MIDALMATLAVLAIVFTMAILMCGPPGSGRGNWRDF